MEALFLLRASDTEPDGNASGVESREIGLYLDVKKGLDMVKDGVDFFKKKQYVPFIEKGQLIASPKAVFIFSQVWAQLSDEFDRLSFPSLIIWINGAPGAGKGTNTRDVMRALSISERPLIVSDLLTSQKYKDKIDHGLLINDREVTYLVFKNIAEKNPEKGIIVDGYPRTQVQAECIYLLLKKLGEQYVKMVSVVLLIDEKTSIKRQLARGQEAIEHNKHLASGQANGALIEVRPTDCDPNVARVRYSTFLQETHEALKLMRQFSEYHEIDAKGSFDEVRDRIYTAFKKR